MSGNLTIKPEQVQKKTGIYVSGATRANHTAVVLTAVSQLEARLGDLLAKKISTINPRIEESEVYNLLFGDNRPLESLSKKADVGYVLGELSQQQKSDLRKLAKVRHAFAHNTKAVGLEDPTIFRLIQDMEVYKFNKKNARIVNNGDV